MLYFGVVDVLKHGSSHIFLNALVCDHSDSERP